MTRVDKKIPLWICLWCLLVRGFKSDETCSSDICRGQYPECQNDRDRLYIHSVSGADVNRFPLDEVIRVCEGRPSCAFSAAPNLRPSQCREAVITFNCVSETSYKELIRRNSTWFMLQRAANYRVLTSNDVCPNGELPSFYVNSPHSFVIALKHFTFKNRRLNIRTCYALSVQDQHGVFSYVPSSSGKAFLQVPANSKLIVRVNCDCLLTNSQTWVTLFEFPDKCPLHRIPFKTSSNTEFSTDEYIILDDIPLGDRTQCKGGETYSLPKCLPELQTPTQTHTTRRLTRRPTAKPTERPTATPTGRPTAKPTVPNENNATVHVNQPASEKDTTIITASAAVVGILLIVLIAVLVIVCRRRKNTPVTTTTTTVPHDEPGKESHSLLTTVGPSNEGVDQPAYSNVTTSNEEVSMTSDNDATQQSLTYDRVGILPGPADIAVHNAADSDTYDQLKRPKVVPDSCTNYENVDTGPGKAIPSTADVPAAADEPDHILIGGCEYAVVQKMKR